MKVETSKLKKASSELTHECRTLIEQLTKCKTRYENMQFLEKVQVWVYGKCELYHWINILDRFDKVLEEAALIINGNEFVLNCDVAFTAEDTRLLLLVLNFTTLLIEHSFSRHLYNSIEHLTKLLSSQNMDITLAVLNLLYMFSKRSNFIPRLSFDKKEILLIQLFNIAERWGDPNYGLALIDCCMKNPKQEFLYQLFIEYIEDNGQIALLEIPDMMDVCNSLPTAEVVKIICDQMPNPSDAIKMRIAHKVRLVSRFNDYKVRLKFVQARLQAVSVLIYSNALHENMDGVLYTGFGEELCELIAIEDIDIVDIRAAVFRTLTSMLHFDRNHNIHKPGSRLPKIIHYTGAERLGGMLPLLVRHCISGLTGSGAVPKYPPTLATALFSLLYHLASYEAGGRALVKSGMMQSLLCVINGAGVDLEHITFVTRAVRVIDLITNIDIAKFHQYNGLNAFIDRLEKEIDYCRENIANEPDNVACKDVIESPSAPYTSVDEQKKDESFSTSTTDGPHASQKHFPDVNLIDDIASETNTTNVGDHITDEAYTDFNTDSYPLNSYYSCSFHQRNVKQISESNVQLRKKITCVTQRAALLKSMLNFLKKSIQDHSHINGMRNIMESSLPFSLRHIISKSDYYGPSLFLLATDVITVFVFNEPSLLSSLQDSGIANVILQSLLHKDVPATREVLGSLPNVFSALCLNERGLLEFMSHEPFDKLLKVLLSPDYLVAMRRRRSSDPLGDTATNLGNAMDDLMKHHPYLRTDAIEAIVRLLNELVRLGTNHNFICWRANKDSISSYSNNSNNNLNSVYGSQEQTNFTNENDASEGKNNDDNENDSSEEEDVDDEEMSSASQQKQKRQNLSAPLPTQNIKSSSQDREAIPLIDYILNVMKFIEAIFSNSSNGEHCREFVLHGGLKPLLKLLSLPNLPVDSPVSTTAQAVANVCKSIFNLTQDSQVIDTALQHLSKIVSELHPLINHVSLPGGSVLLYELITCKKIEDGFVNADYTPLLHNMSSVHGYVVMLVYICRNTSSEMRSLLLQRWGHNSSSGLKLLQNLVQLYTSLVWESTVLLSLCTDESIARNSFINWDEIFQNSSESTLKIQNENSTIATSTNNKRDKGTLTKPKIKPEEQLRYIKSLLAASSRLGRALAELFGTLVKLSVGTPHSRQRRNNDYLSTLANSKMPSADAKEIARVLSSILVNGFCHGNFVPKPKPKLKLTFLICSVGFTGPMLFDDKRSCFHLMISQFCEENGLQAFFDMFDWALSIENEDSSSKNDSKNENTFKDHKEDEYDFPEGTGEFLDAWLQLLEKMINPRAILDSPYALPTARKTESPFTINFEPIFYLIQVHQLALLAIKRIWKRKPIPNYGVSMTESIMTILKHLIKSNSMLSENFKSRMIGTAIHSKLPTQKGRSQKVPTDEATTNSDHLKILTDMGFLRQHVIDALRNTHSLEQATDYLLNHPEACGPIGFRDSSSVASNTLDTHNDMDTDISAFPSSSSSTAAPKAKLNTTKDKKSTSPKINHGFSNIKLVPIEEFDIFCFDTLERVFSFMELLPETVNTGADLISVLYWRLRSSDKQKFMINWVKNLAEWTEHVLQNIKGSSFKNNKQDDVVTGMTATKLYTRFKVAFLLLEETYADFRQELCLNLCKSNCLNSMILLFNKTKLILDEQLSLEVKPISPSWLQSLVELMDAIDSVSVILQRKTNMRAVCSDVWKWYDTSTGKWNVYSEPNNLIIKNSFNAGERSVAISIGRQRYTINFNCMTQVSEASGSHRPVMPALKITEAIAMFYQSSCTKVDNIVTRVIKSDNNDKRTSDQEVKLSLRSMLNFKDEGHILDETIVQYNDGVTEESKQTESSKDGHSTSNSKTPKSEKNRPIKNFTSKNQHVYLHDEPTGLSKFNTALIIENIVGLLNPNIFLNFETKLSLLKLCARLTKDHENAKVFYKHGGIDLLLKMNQSCGLTGFPTYAIIIIRHVLEAPKVLQESFERVLSSRTVQSIPIGHRDLLFVLTQVSSAVARNPEIFLAASKQSLSADYITNPTFSFDDSKFVVKMKSPNNCKRVNPPFLDGTEEIYADNISVKVVKDLLNAVIQPCNHYLLPKGKVEEKNFLRDKHVLDPGLRISSNCKTSSVPSKSQEKYQPCCCSWHTPSSSHNHQKPVLPRATLIKVLADAVRSYQSFVPQVIIEHRYTSSDSLLIENEQSCLSFFLDYFLPIVRRQQDAEVSVMSRVLLSSLSDCYGNTSVQMKVAEEVHTAIVRTLLLPESTDKHTRLQVLIGLLPMMIESPLLANKIHIQRNNMYRVLLRQGIMTDLCRIAQYNDLSNSNTFSTILSVLRPMEILLRLTIAPGVISAKRVLFGNSTQGSHSHGNRRLFPRLSSRSNATTSSVTNGRDNVLRDIIRNVLSDRRHGFEFIFNPDDFIVSAEETNHRTGAYDEEEESHENVGISLPSNHSNGRSQLHFDRLLEDFMQNERDFQRLRINNRNENVITSSATNPVDVVIDHHRHSNHNSESGNNENEDGGSDGASSSSETAAITVDNVTMADVSTSDSNDSDSNDSMENEDRNEEEDEEEEENDEGADDPSETDADDDTRQFIEVFDDIYERESSETASNDADIDADDEGSEVGGGVNSSRVSRTVNTENVSLEESNGNRNQSITTSLDILNSSLITESSSITPNNALLCGNGAANLAPTSISWISPRMAIGERDANLGFEGAIDASPNISNEMGSEVNSANNSEQNSLAAASGSQSYSTVASQNLNLNTQRRDPTRRLVFLDQQYCTSMPSYNNPTEEGQIELFNQDALHWWLEEAKHLDFESQTNACLFVGHMIIPYLIKELKTSHKLLKAQEASNASFNETISLNRRSAIPVLIQPTSNPAILNAAYAEITNNMSRAVGTVRNSSQDISGINDYQTFRGTNSITLGLNQQNINVTPTREIYISDDRNPDVFSFDTSNSEQNPSSTSNALTDSNLNVNEVDQQLQAMDRDDFNERSIENVSIEDDTAFDDDTDEIRTIVDGALSSTIGVNFEAEIQNILSQSNPQSVRAESFGNSEIHINNSVITAHVDQDVTNVNNAGTTEGAIGGLTSAISQNILPALSPSSNISPMSLEVRSALGGLEIPEGVDPSFLAALPEEMREEVIEEHLRMTRVRQRAQNNALQVTHDALLEVNPEFLAALPPSIQSEVLLQQRIEQQRQAAQSANPEEPVDAAAFFRNLPNSLRQAILTDMDESQITSLPPELAEEAQYLRGDWENRNDHRIDTNQANTLSDYLSARFPSSLQNSNDDSRWHANSIWYDANSTTQSQSQPHHHTTIIHQHHQALHGKPITLLLLEDEGKLLDPDSLATLLLFLFIEDSKFNFNRLHRIIRNLCYHVPTREWIINALICIIQRTNEKIIKHHAKKSINPQWLKLRTDAAFGYKPNVFLIHTTSDEYECANDSGSFSNKYCISINPQAGHMIIRNCLDMLLVLAKHFPRSFLPYNRENKASVKKGDTSSNPPTLIDKDLFTSTVTSDIDAEMNNHVKQINDSPKERENNNFKLYDFPSTSKAASQVKIAQTANDSKKELQYSTNSPHFWDVLLNVDLNTQERLSNVYAFPISSTQGWEWENKTPDFLPFNDSHFTKILEMLPCKIICRSPQLTDMIVKLLVSLSGDLPKEEENAETFCNTVANTTRTEILPEIKKETQKNHLIGNRYKRKIYSKNFSRLQLVIKILTHQRGTTKGLENISKLIADLSQCSGASNAILIQYLTAAILGLANKVQQSIQNLLDELRNFYSITNDNSLSATTKNAAILQDRLTTVNVTVSAPINIKSSLELQLPAMKKLLLSTSTQPYFLRTLKIFITVLELFNAKQIFNSSNILKIKPSLSKTIVLDNLWKTLSECLEGLEKSKDEYAVLVLQPTVEAFFLIHAPQKKVAKNPRETQNDFIENQTSDKQYLIDLNARNAPLSSEEIETQLKHDRNKFLTFAEKHKTVLNQILRQSPTHLSDGPFAVLVNHTRILDFDVKRKYFQTELERIDEGVRREENTVTVRRVTVFEDSFRVLYRLGPEEWKNRFYIVFEDEEGQDAGGLLREWYVIISREIFNPMYALFCVSPGDRVTYMINPSSHANPNHLSYFKFVGRVIAKAIHDNKLLECYFTRSFYKHILGKHVKYTDMESQDYEFYKGLDYLMKNNISTLGYELTFSTEVQEFGVTQVRDLIPNGRNIAVTEENKFDYVQLVCQLKMSGSIRQQLDAFLDGFYDIIPKHLISIFNEQELELLISGLPDIDIEDLKVNTEYHKYNAKSMQIQWFWRALRSFEQADRAKFLQFVTGTSKVPLQGFRSLEGMNGIQKFQIHRDDRSTDRLPCAHTCFNQLDLPMYKSYEKLRFCLLKAIHECSEGFGFA